MNYDLPHPPPEKEIHNLGAQESNGQLFEEREKTKKCSAESEG
jgi:hypothetical protein